MRQRTLLYTWNMVTPTEIQSRDVAGQAWRDTCVCALVHILLNIRIPALALHMCVRIYN